MNPEIPRSSESESADSSASHFEVRPKPPSALQPQPAPPPRKRRLGRAAIFAFVAFDLVMFAVAGGGYWYLERWADTPQGLVAAPPAPAVSVTIPKGSTTAAIADILQGAGLIDDARLFRAMILRDGKRAGLQAGQYALRPPMSPRELAAKLQKGSFQRKITIPEGWTAKQIDADLAKRGEIAAGQWVELAARPPAEPPAGEALPQGIEGYCFPDTYFLEAGETHTQLAERMLRHFTKTWGELEPARRDTRSASLTAREVVDLASIIQRESRRNDELPRMASVFLNRLQKGMKLQSCATVHYALGEVWWRELTYDDLKLDSPYNTYKYAGLPPGPVSNPGREAIEAVLRPAATDDLFFVYRGDGTHEFTKTYKEHVKATKRFRSADPQAELQGPEGEGGEGATPAASQPAAPPATEAGATTATKATAPPAAKSAPSKKKPRRR